jgi:hypothetical protein
MYFGLLCTPVVFVNHRYEGHGTADRDSGLCRRQVTGGCRQLHIDIYRGMGAKVEFLKGRLDWFRLLTRFCGGYQ